MLRFQRVIRQHDFLEKDLDMDHVMISTFVIKTREPKFFCSNHLLCFVGQKLEIEG